MYWKTSLTFVMRILYTYENFQDNASCTNNFLIRNLQLLTIYLKFNKKKKIEIKILEYLLLKTNHGTNGSEP